VTYFFKFFSGPLHVVRAWTSSGGGWVHSIPVFGSANSSKIHGEWRFHFFPKFFFLNLVHTWTFISTVGNFVS
jgi:hypothetical protein